MDEQRIEPLGLVGDSGNAVTVLSGLVLCSSLDRAAFVSFSPALLGGPGLYFRNLPLWMCGLEASSAAPLASQARPRSRSGRDGMYVSCAAHYPLARGDLTKWRMRMQHAGVRIN